MDHQHHPAEERTSVILRCLPRPAVPEVPSTRRNIRLLEVQFEAIGGQQQLLAFQPYHAPTILVAHRLDFRIDREQTFAMESTTAIPLLLCWGRNAEQEWGCLVIGDARYVTPTTISAKNILDEHMPDLHSWIQSVPTHLQVASDRRTQ